MFFVADRPSSVRVWADQDSQWLGDHLGYAFALTCFDGALNQRDNNGRLVLCSGIPRAAPRYGWPEWKGVPRCQCHAAACGSSLSVSPRQWTAVTASGESCRRRGHRLVSLTDPQETFPRLVRSPHRRRILIDSLSLPFEFSPNGFVDTSCALSSAVRQSSSKSSVIQFRSPQEYPRRAFACGLALQGGDGLRLRHVPFVHHAPVRADAAPFLHDGEAAEH
jgi:hypothetical protein